MTILEIAQGRYQDLTGEPLEDTLAAMKQHDEEFLQKYPSCAKYHRPCYSVREVPEGKTAPWGYEWYQVDADQRLRIHSVQHDSSG